MRDDSVEPTQAEREQAKVRPSFWVYKIVGNYGRDDAVPSEAIAGAWQVDAQGNIFGDFIPNPNYRGPREEGEEVQSPSLGAMKVAQLGPGSVVSESEAQADEREQKKQP